MRPAEALSLPALRAGRACGVCGAPTRASHREYVGRGEVVDLHRCTACQALSRGAIRDREQQEQSPAVSRRGGRRGSASRRDRPLPDGGSPDNPVIGADLAKLLQQRMEPERQD